MEPVSIKRLRFDTPPTENVPNQKRTVSVRRNQESIICNVTGRWKIAPIEANNEEVQLLARSYTLGKCTALFLSKKPCPFFIRLNLYDSAKSDLSLAQKFKLFRNCTSPGILRSEKSFFGLTFSLTERQAWISVPRLSNIYT